MPWTVVHQVPLSKGFSRQQYWTGLPFPSPGNLPDPGIKPRSLALQAGASPSKPPGKPTNRVTYRLNNHFFKMSEVLGHAGLVWPLGFRDYIHMLHAYRMDPQ